MKRILFVNNEAKTLNGLKRMRPLGHEPWEMIFAGTCHDTLAVMERGTVDAIVADVSVSGMSGVSLLDAVKTRYPGTVRIILSEERDEDAVARFAGPAHRCLAKPCNVADLRAALERTFALREFLAAPALKRIVSGMAALPVLPETYVALATELRFGDPCIRRVGRIVTGDVSLSSKLLQLVNSAFFGLHARVTRPEQAVSLLGIRRTRALVLSLKVFEEYGENDGMPLARVQALQRHSLQVAALAQTIASIEGFDAAALDAAFLSGLLHDVGRLVLAANLPNDYAHWLRCVENATIHFPPESEQAAFGATHAQVGAYLLGLWGLPDAVVETVAYHHRPMSCWAETFGPLAAVHAADALFDGNRGGSPGQELDMCYLRRIGVAGRVNIWRGLSAALLERLGDAHEEKERENYESFVLSAGAESTGRDG